MPDNGFQTLVDANYAKVFYHILIAVRNDHDAADITQNTFIKAFIHYSSLRTPGSAGAWLFTICNNEIKQFYRRRQAAAPEPARQAAPDHTALYDAIDRLPDAQRQVVVLKYFGGYTMRELAIALSLNESTVKSRLYEARQALKGTLTATTMLTALSKERRHILMSILDVCAAGAKTVPCLSLHAQKQLLQCARDNVKFNETVLAELTHIAAGPEFLSATGGSLSYDELVRVLACCDEAMLYRIIGQEYKSWRNAAGNQLISDVAALYKTGGYVSSIETRLRVPSIQETVRWYKRVLGWTCDNSDADMDEWGHASIDPCGLESSGVQYKGFKGFHLEKSDDGGAPHNCRFFVFVSGLEELRATVLESGWDKEEEVQEIYDNNWGTRAFYMKDLNGFALEFCEWKDEGLDWQQ